MPAKNTWPQSRIDKLVALYKQGATLDKISEEMNTPITTVKSKIRAIREEYNLGYRDPKQIKRKARPKTVITEFDKLFSGPIPCGHWMITKKWELTDEQKESLDAED